LIEVENLVLPGAKSTASKVSTTPRPATIQRSSSDNVSVLELGSEQEGSALVKALEKAAEEEGSAPAAKSAATFSEPDYASGDGGLKKDRDELSPTRK
jgi:hypothetical protein